MDNSTTQEVTEQQTEIEQTAAPQAENGLDAEQELTEIPDNAQLDEAPVNDTTSATGGNIHMDGHEAPIPGDLNEIAGSNEVVQVAPMEAGTHVAILSMNGFASFAVLVLIFVLAKLAFTKFVIHPKRGTNPEATNFAYKISLFSLFISLSLILTSVIYGDATDSWKESTLKLLTYSVLGILLLIATGYIFDKIAFTKISVTREIANGNVAASIADAGNFFASGLIISAALKWQEFKYVEGVVAVLSIYIVSQCILTIATLLRIYFFNDPKNDVNFQKQIAQNNTAAAIDFAGRRIATALAITASTSLLPYQDGFDLPSVILNWILVSTIMVISLNILAWIASKIIFWDKDIYQDVVLNNKSSALCDAAIYISFGIILYGTLV